MASTQDLPTQNQLKLARTALWHQDGNALRTLDDLREWLDNAGLVAYTPHQQFAAAPQPSFAEAVLGRPENGWIPKSAATDEEPSEEESNDADLDSEDEDEDFEGEENAEDQEDENEEEDDNEPADAVEFADENSSDDEVMVSNDDEAAEDEGDEIAEEDSVDAAAEPAAEEPQADPINGFSAEERETVRHMLARLVEDGAAVPLNLLGSTIGEPDFICSAQAFSFVYTLRGDKNFKNEPAQTGSLRVSPLAAKVYDVLKEKGAMAPHELTSELGQGVVDSAVIRALSELWAILRVVPMPDANGEPAKWELTSGRYLRHIKAGANAGQPTALSALLSLYLSQAVAATSDEMEIFLSPLAARSRVREVVGGLAATNQLDDVIIDGKTAHFLPGALDSLPQEVATARTPFVQQRSRYEDDDRRAMIEERNARFAAEGGAPAGERRPFRAGGFKPREGSAPRSGGFGQRREGGFGGPRREGGFAPRREGGFSPQRRSGGFSGGGFAGGGSREGFTPRPDRERRPFTRPAGEEGAATDRPRNEFARPWEQDRKPAGEGAERRPFTPREGGDRPFTPRGDRPSYGDRKPFGGDRESRGDRPFTPRGDRPSYGDRKPFTPREGGDRPFTPRGDRPSYGDRKPFAPRGDRPSYGDRKPFTPREGGGDRPFTPRGDRPSYGDRKPFTPREGGDRPFTPRGDRPSYGGGDRKPFAPRGDRPSYGDRKPFTPREGGSDRPFTPRGDRPSYGGGDRKPFAPRGDRPFTPRGDRPSYGGGDRKPFTPREGGSDRPFTPRGDRPSYGGGDRKPFAPRGDRPFTPRGDRPSYGGGDRKPFTPREGGGDRPFTPRGDRPSYGDRKPFTPREGGDRKPFAPRGDRPSGPGGFSRGPKFGGGGFGGDRKGPGGFSKPGFKPSFRGPGSGPARGGAPKRRPE